MGVQDEQINFYAQIVEHFILFKLRVQDEKQKNKLLCIHFEKLLLFKVSKKKNAIPKNHK